MKDVTKRRFVNRGWSGCLFVEFDVKGAAASNRHPVFKLLEDPENKKGDGGGGDAEFRRLATEILTKRIHLGECVLVAGAVCSSNAVLEAIESLFRTAQLGESLGRHLIAGDVVGVVLDKGVELD
jgi:hypothetical protein